MFIIGSTPKETISLPAVESLGFTGTQRGMTKKQSEGVVSFLKQLPNLKEVHHGDCVGADDEFDFFVRMLQHDKILKHVIIHIHPPIKSIKRAFCAKRLICIPYVHEPLPYLDRNKAIVDASQCMLATPAEVNEQLRSGTWSTIRYTRQTLTPLAIIYP